MLGFSVGVPRLLKLPGSVRCGLGVTGEDGTTKVACEATWLPSGWRSCGHKSTFSGVPQEVQLLATRSPSSLQYVQKNHALILEAGCS